MNEENDLGRAVVDIDDDLLDDGPYDALLKPRVGGRGKPDGLQICCQSGKRGWRLLRARGCRRVVGGDLRFDVGDATKRGVPAGLEFVGHEAVGGVGGIVLAPGTVSGVARRLEVAKERRANPILSVDGLRLGGYRCRNRSGLDDLKQSRRDGVIDPQSAECDTTRLAGIELATTAGIAGNVVLGARVTGDQFATAAAAAQEPREQRIAVFGRAVMPARRDVVADHPTDRLRSLPIHVTLVRAGLERQPFGARFPAARHPHARAIIARHRTGLTIGIGAAVGRIADDAVDRCVTRAAPDGVAVGSPARQIEPMLVEPQQALSRAAEFGHLVEHQRDRLLNPSVGILLQSVAGLHEADRCADDEFAAAGLLVAGRQRALPQEIEFVLVEAPLEAEQEPVVALTGRVHCFLIDQHGIDDAAHLDELLPVPTVAGEARHLSRRHRADLAETDLGDHALEPDAGDAARRRAAEIIVDGIDLRPAERCQAIPHSILQRAALAIVHDLVGRGLPDVEDRLAGDVVRPDLVRRHRTPPLARECRPRDRGAIAPSGGSAPGEPPPERRPMPASAPPRRRVPRTDRIVSSWIDGRDAPCVGTASWSPRISSRGTVCAPATGIFDDAAPATDASASSVVNASSAAISTHGWASMRIGATATRSSIHAGNSRERCAASPSRRHRATQPLAFSITSWTSTMRPAQGCQGYRTSRFSVRWVFWSLVV